MAACSPGSAVHPHGRGENVSSADNPRKSNGSPPRAWGKLVASGSTGIVARFTPTGVGKTEFSNVLKEQLTVHPHGRGENAQIGAADPQPGGSPPRAWGKHYPSQVSHRLMRFTPTGVGKTLSRNGSSSGFAVHPHGRGENAQIGAADPQPGGSPPRAWGKLVEQGVHRPRLRFTPTGVGKTPVKMF